MSSDTVRERGDVGSYSFLGPNVTGTVFRLYEDVRRISLGHLLLQTLFSPPFPGGPVDGRFGRVVGDVRSKSESRISRTRSKGQKVQVKRLVGHVRIHISSS